jgi:hypothetical protein
MKKYNTFFKENNITCRKYNFAGKVTFADTNLGRIVIKNSGFVKEDILNYLKSRNFNYYPEIISKNNDFYITKYIENVDMPDSQKMADMINLVALLHSKTTFYEVADEDDYKKIYEDITSNIEYLKLFYNEYMDIIEMKVFMSPSEYLLAQNISKIMGALNFCSNEIEQWYEMVKEKKKQRLVVLHNNLDLNHFIRSDMPYLVNWEKSKIEAPIFDLYKLYKKYASKFDFAEILHQYEMAYKLLPEEKKLLFILISLPEKMDVQTNEYKMCREVNNLIKKQIYTESFISPYYLENAVQNN